MKRSLAVAFLAAVFAVFAAAGQAVDLEQYRPKGAVIPAPHPAGDVMRTVPYLQEPSADGMTVMWLTNVPCRSWVEYGTDTLRMQSARTLDEGMMVCGKINRVRLGGLESGREYFYRVCSQEVLFYSAYYKSFGDTVRSETYSFRTWNDRNGDWTLLIYNDLHRRHKVMEHMHRYVADSGYDLVVFNGDCINDMENEKQIVDPLVEYIRIYGGERIPAIFIRGNHEIRGAGSLMLWDYVAKYGGRSYGAFTFNGTRFVMLDCGEDKSDDSPIYYGMNDFSHHRAVQTEFLHREISSREFKKADRRILIHHIPIYGRPPGKFNECHTLWHLVLKKAPFDIAINGHQHRYQFVARGGEGNNFPVVIGGGYKPDDATVTLLSKRGKMLRIEVLDYDGKVLLDMEL